MPPYDYDKTKWVPRIRSPGQVPQLERSRAPVPEPAQSSPSPATRAAWTPLTAGHQWVRESCCQKAIVHTLSEAQLLIQTLLIHFSPSSQRRGLKRVGHGARACFRYLLALEQCRPSRRPISRLPRAKGLQSIQAEKPRVAYPMMKRNLIQVICGMNLENVFACREVLQ